MQGLQVFRTRFANDIVAEFLPAHNLSSQKVAILTPGCPGYPGGKTELMKLLARQGFWSIVPSYRGTWESRGEFLALSPHEDVLDVMDGVRAGFYDLWGGTEHQVKDAAFYLLGGSFGGAAALLASRDPRVKKAATLSAVVDWREQENTMEPLNVMAEYLPSAYGMAYRTHPDAWKRLSMGDYYSPVYVQEELDASKLLLIHAKDDLVVHAAPARKFSEEIGARYIELQKGGHMGVHHAALPRIWKYVKRHFLSA